MGRFRDGHLDLLVGTTVIEVGVDVPEATLMIIEGAERFGLAQLHQLRGRVGRGTAASWCVLVSEAAEGTTEHERLRAVAATTDGFALAEARHGLVHPDTVDANRVTDCSGAVVRPERRVDGANQAVVRAAHATDDTFSIRSPCSSPDTRSFTNSVYSRNPV